MDMAKLKWLGHAAFSIEIDGKTVLIDPFLSGNPKAAVAAEKIDKADLIAVTHDHGDHYGDCVSLSKRLGSKVIAMFETANKAESEGANVVGANIGSPFEVDGIRFAFTQAIHTGNPSGVVVMGKSTTIYHAGDTGFFGDMKVIGEMYKPTVALLPTGGFFTMGPAEAAVAVSYIKPKIAVPMHYGTFPPIDSDPKIFESETKKLASEVSVKIMEPGQEIEV